MIAIAKKYSVLALIVAILAVFAVALPVEAQTPFPECNVGGAATTTDFCQTVKPGGSAETKLFGPNSLVSRVTETIIFVTGSISVLMLVIGGLRYVLSNGDPQQTASAKNTVIYAIVGLVIALAAEAILRLVLQRL